MRWNDYVARVTNESAMMAAAKTHQEFLRDRSLYDAHQRQIQERPTPQQIDNGDALNAAVAQLSDPRLGSSSLRAATAPIPASLIAEVPFQNATERVTLMLDQLKTAVKWPEVFEEPRFAEDKKAFDDVVARGRREDEEGDISPRTIQEAKNVVKNLRAKLAARPLSDESDQRAAMKFINAFTALVGLLDKPDTRQALSELRKVKNTQLGNLLGFMHAYNLRFGPATTLKERQAYAQLYPIVREARDQILSEAKLESKPSSQANAGSAGEFFQNMDESRLKSRTPPAAQPPGNPQ
jgi:hypothetical protein